MICTVSNKINHRNHPLSFMELHKSRGEGEGNGAIFEKIFYNILSKKIYKKHHLRLFYWKGMYFNALCNKIYHKMVVNLVVSLT